MLAHRVAEAAPALAPLPWQAFAAELRRLAVRQRNPEKLHEPEARAFAEGLATWAASTGLDAVQLAAWLLVASFCARGGGEG